MVKQRYRKAKTTKKKRLLLVSFKTECIYLEERKSDVRSHSIR